MAEHGGGSIINTTSIGGINAGGGLMTYRASKAAVIHLTRSIAIDLAEHGIRVNCVAPAHIPTDINTSYDQAAIVRLMQPLQRMGSPSDVANAVALPRERPVGADHRDRAAGRRRHDRRPAHGRSSRTSRRAPTRRRGDEPWIRRPASTPATTTSTSPRSRPTLWESRLPRALAERGPHVVDARRQARCGCARTA